MIFLFFIINTEDDLEKFIQIYSKYKKMIYSISNFYLQRKELADENSQEVLLYIAENFDKIGEVESHKTKGLIALITAAKAKNCFKYNSRHNPDSFKYLLYDEVEPLNEHYFDNCDLTILSSLINELPDSYRTPLVLKYAYGFKSKDIAKILNISDNLVRKRIQIAKKQLSQKTRDR